MQTLAAYATWRRPGSVVFFKGRLGVLREEITFSGNLPGLAASGSDTGASLGAGVGISLKQAGAIVFDVTVVEADILFIAGGYTYFFR